MTEIINALIVDDEQHARDSLQQLLERYFPEIKIRGHANSAEEARVILDTCEIDVLFLDVSMPNEGGFEFLESIDRSKYMFVFVTAHDQYALRALRASAVDYLQKPIDPDELRQTVEKLMVLKKTRSLSTIAANAYNQSLQNLVSNTLDKKGVNRLCIPCMHGFSIIEVNDILYLYAENNYTVFHLNNRPKIVVSKSIKDYEEILDPFVFFRNHKSSIINLKYLKEFSKVDGYYAVMSDNSSISVSRRRLPEFFRAVEEYNCLAYSI
jgi:two-component system, LytTR family, response regulator